MATAKLYFAGEHILPGGAAEQTIPGEFQEGFLREEKKKKKKKELSSIPRPSPFKSDSDAPEGKFWLFLSCGQALEVLSQGPAPY